MFKFHNWYMVVYYTMVLFCFFSTNLNPYSMEWVICEFFDIEISLKMNFTMNSMIFTFTVVSIFSSVFHYSLFYMNNEVYVKRFFMTLISFALSMVVMINSGNFFTTLIGWDGLGVSSMLLIMFYHSNSSLKASMHTFIVNRVGDCFFLIFIFMMFCKSSSINHVDIEDLSSSFFGLLLVMMSVTKSAQFPFSSWLTKAMEAPTPVSSLVHSSTLVTAGIYVLFVNKSVWSSSMMCLKTLFIMSILTMFISSVAGLMEVDLKKIIAYSTLSQLGFILFSFSLNLTDQGFFHLIMHAFYKAMMFMGVGYVIHNSSGWQDIRYLTLNYSCSPNILKILVTAIFSLCGMPFMSGFYSKDLILDSMISMNFSIIYLIFLLISLLLTVMYSFRVCWYLMKGMKSVNMVSDNYSTGISSMFFLMIMSCVMGSSMVWHSIPSLPSVNFPKIVILFFMLLTLLLFWVSKPSLGDKFFMKTNFYLYVVLNLVVYKFHVVISKIMWNVDLMSLFGYLIKFPKILTNNIHKKHMNESFMVVELVILFNLMIFLWNFMNI